MPRLPQLDQQGFAITKAFLASTEIAALIALVEQETVPHKGRGGLRDIIDRLPELRAIADHPTVKSVVSSILGTGAFIVRATLFDKTPSANWKVPWHQDVTIAVDRRMEIPGFGPWSIKDGVQHVQPPTDVLDNMITVRVHLDPCPARNGALRVMPGTHRLGRIDQNRAPDHVIEDQAIVCEVPSGAALVMRPLLLHASSPSQEPGHRRVLHFDFATGDLPSGLQWRMR